MFDPEQPPPPPPPFAIRRYGDPKAPLTWPEPNVLLTTDVEVVKWVAGPGGDLKCEVPVREQRARHFHEYPKNVRRLEMWDWMCTLTFNGRVGLQRARDAFHQWLGKLAPNDHLDALVTFEKTREGFLHIHALLLFHPRAPHPRIREGDRLWTTLRPETGHARINEFNPDRRGAWYVDKKGGAEIVVHCPRRPSCRRKRGCVQRSGIWFALPSS